ncbi:MAG: hypothetical protein NC191_09535 [Muribaculaceae bacterium]|nr:hypothetical protein [Muribaculaceae bacterium]
MPGSRRESFNNWYELSKIDYYTQFIKAWLAFNAWMKDSYPDKNEKQIISEIKTYGRIKSKILAYIDVRSTYDEAIKFKSLISNLHEGLINNNLQNRNKHLDFRRIVIEENIETIREITYSNLKYKAEKVNNKYFLDILKQDGTSKFHYEQNKYNINELTQQSDYLALSPTSQEKLIETYSWINPYREENLIHSGQGSNYIGIGGVHFINDEERIAKALIEIIYGLRCLLFHGELVPREEYNKIYESAYYILRIFLEAIA